MTALLKFAVTLPFEKKKGGEADLQAARLFMEMARTEAEGVRRARDVEWRINICLWALLAVSSAALLSTYPIDRVSFFRSSAFWTVPVFVLLLHGLWLAQSHAEQKTGRADVLRLKRKAAERLKDLEILGPAGRLDLPADRGVLALMLPLCVTLCLSAGSVWLVKEKASALDEINQRFTKLSARVDEICGPVDYLEGITPVLYAYQAPVVDPAAETTMLFDLYFRSGQQGLSGQTPAVGH